MCICMYVHTYVCVCLCSCVRMCVRMHGGMYVCEGIIYVCLFAYYVFVCMYVCFCMYVSFVSMYACMYVVLYLYCCSEESTAIPGVGVDKLMEVGKLDRVKNGPVFWVDSADSQPCMGTAGCAMWTLRVEGRLFHSGLPHKGINSLELAMEAVKYIQERFYQDYPPVSNHSCVIH